MRKICNALFITFLIILLILIGNIVYLRFVLNKQIASVFGKSFFIVETGSMEPAIQSGELIITSKTNKYGIGDIVTVLDENDCIYTHRIVGIKEKSIITKGDSNNVFDEEVNSDLIIGKVVFHSKILGLFIVYALKPITILYIVILFIIILKDLFISKEESNEEESINS